MIVSMKNEAGLVRQVKVGFCWTAFFFGPLPFLFRGMPMNVWFFAPFIANVVLPFRMNKYTAHYYLEHGYKPVGKGWNTAAPVWGVALPPPSDLREMQEDVLGRDDPSDTKFKFKTWHKVVAGVLVVGAIAGNINKHHAASEPEQNTEVTAPPAFNTTAATPAAALVRVKAEQQSQNVSSDGGATRMDERQEGTSYNKAIYLETAAKVESIIQKANQSGNLDRGICSDTISQYREAVSKIINEYAGAGQPDMGYELATGNIRATWIDSIANNCGVRE